MLIYFRSFVGLRKNIFFGRVSFQFSCLVRVLKKKKKHVFFEYYDIKKIDLFIMNNERQVLFKTIITELSLKADTTFDLPLSIIPRCSFTNWVYVSNGQEQ